MDQDYHLCPVCHHHIALFVDLVEDLAQHLRSQWRADEDCFERRYEYEFADEAPGVFPLQVRIQTLACLVCIERARLALGWKWSGHDFPPMFPLSIERIGTFSDQRDGWCAALEAPLSELQGELGDDLRIQVRERDELATAALNSAANQS